MLCCVDKIKTDLIFIMNIIFLCFISVYVDIVFFYKGLVPLVFTFLIVIVVNKKNNHKDEGMRAINI